MRSSAVLVPVFRDAKGDLRLVVIKRAAGGSHGGQLAFPGGKREPEDTSLLDTALRETEEEIGLARQRVEVLEDLPVTSTLTSGYRIAPYLGRIDPPDAWQPDAREIASVIEVRLADLEDPKSHRHGLLGAWSKPQWLPYYRIGDDRLWGATYRILRPLVPRLLRGEWHV